MPYSISTLLACNLHDVFGENDPARRRAAINEIFTEDCVFCEPKGVYRGRDEIDRVADAITLTFDISQLPTPRSWAIVGGSGGCRAAPGRRQLTPGLILLLPGTAGSPPSISFLTSQRESALQGNRPAIVSFLLNRMSTIEMKKQAAIRPPERDLELFGFAESTAIRPYKPFA